MNNQDDKVIKDFGDEWTKYNFKNADIKSLKKSFDQYFSIFPWNEISKSSIGFDMGCGSGRWAQFIAPKVAHLNCVDPSNAIKVAQDNLKIYSNVSFFNETSNSCSLSSGSQDFGYSLGVLHHIPDTEEALKDCARLLKSGAPFLLYLYYSFENKPVWFRLIWRVSNFFRKIISILPTRIKLLVCNFIAFTIYLPLSKFSFFLEKLGFNVENIPLSDYRGKPFYICKNDALDRFGTRLEQRFSKKEIIQMLENSGFDRILFSESTPYWCCLAYKK